MLGAGGRDRDHQSHSHPDSARLACGLGLLAVGNPLAPAVEVDVVGARLPQLRHRIAAGIPQRLRDIAGSSPCRLTSTSQVA